MMLVSQHWRRADMPTTISGWNTKFPAIFLFTASVRDGCLLCCAFASCSANEPCIPVTTLTCKARGSSTEVKFNFLEVLMPWQGNCNPIVPDIFRSCCCVDCVSFNGIYRVLEKFCSCFTSKKVLIRTVLDALFPTYTCPSVICTTCGTALYGMSCCFEYGLLCHDVVSGTACENGCG